MPVPGKVECILRAKGPYLHFTRILKQAGVLLFLVFERQGVHLSYKIKQGFRWSSLRRPLVILRSFSMKRPNSYKGKLSSKELEADLSFKISLHLTRDKHYVPLAFSFAISSFSESTASSKILFFDSISFMSASSVFILASC